MKLIKRNDYLSVLAAVKDVPETGNAVPDLWREARLTRT